MNEKCTQKQVKELCQIYSKETGSAFVNYYDKEFLEWLEIINDAKRGIASVPVEDLQDLNRDRGMRAAGLTRERLERQYMDWLELAHDPVISVRICNLV